MNIDYLIQLLTNRLNGLLLAKDQAFGAGDLERIVAVDAEILDVQNTITKLNLVSSIEKTAAVTPFNEKQVVQNGIDASFTLANLTDATACLALYDIEPYATDPFHEQKIETILEKMPLMDSSNVVEMYIKKATPDSPLSGAMVWDAAQQRGVDVRLMMALMELDSRFGTVGVAVATLNPGNVGNNDAGDTRTYDSWEEGVMAVAKWLDNHRIIEIVPEVPVTPIEETPVETPIETTPEVPVAPVEEIPVEVPIEETPPVLPVEVPVESPVVIPDASTDAPLGDTVVGVVKRKPRRKIA